jgi:Domain of unknown function (DUF4328)
VLVAISVVDTFAAWVDWDRYDLLDRIVNNGSFTIGEADTSDSRNAAVGVLQLALLGLGALGFILWFVRAYANVSALGSSRRFSVKWAGWGWFVPILALWRPKQIANDIWRGSDPEHPERTQDEDAPVAPFVTVWWILWLLSNWLSQFGARASFSGDDASSLRGATVVYLVGDSVDIVAAALAVVFIRRVSARQLLRADRRQTAGSIEA